MSSDTALCLAGLLKVMVAMRPSLRASIFAVAVVIVFPTPNVRLPLWGEAKR